MSTADDRRALEQAAQALGVALSPAQTEALLAYLALLHKWNQVYNLTAVRDPAEMLTHHVLDSLAVLEPLRQQLRSMDGGASGGAHGGDAGGVAGSASSVPLRVLDVGSGAGLPGVVLAICCPHWQVDCVDTVAKKAAFVQQVAVSLQLPNLRGIHARVERLTAPYDVVCSRAFASLADFATWSGGALAPHGVWMAMKGKHPAQEIAELPAQVEVFHVDALSVPGLDAQRCIVWMRKRPGGG